MKRVVLILTLSIISLKSLASLDCSLSKFKKSLYYQVSKQVSLNQTKFDKFLLDYSSCPIAQQEKLKSFFYQVTTKVYSNNKTLDLLAALKPSNIKDLSKLLGLLYYPLTQGQRKNLFTIIKRFKSSIEKSNEKDKIYSTLKYFGISNLEIKTSSPLCNSKLYPESLKSVKEQVASLDDTNTKVSQRFELESLFNNSIANNSTINVLLLYFAPNYFEKLQKRRQIIEDRNIELQAAGSELSEQDNKDEEVIAISTNYDRDIFELPKVKITSAPFPKVLSYDFHLNKHIEFVGSITNDQKYASFDLNARSHKGSKYFIFKSGIQFDVPIKDDPYLKLNLVSSPSIRVDGFHSGLKLDKLSTNRSLATLELGTELEIKTRNFGSLKLKLIGGPQLSVSGSQKGRVSPYGFLLFSIRR